MGGYRSYESSEMLGIYGKNIMIAKGKIQKNWRIGNICFTSVAVIGGRLLSNSPKNNNHVRKYQKYLLSVIITLGENVSGGDTVLMMELESITW